MTARTMDFESAAWWLSFIESDIRPGYLTNLASQLGCAPSLEAVTATLRLIVEAER